MTSIILLLLSLLPLLGLLHPGLPITHDGQDHVARIANFYLSLSEGNIIPRWAGNLNWGYGHPVLMFLYPLPSYIGSLFRAIGFSFVDSTKLVFGVGFLGSVFAMYLWAGSRWGKPAGFAAALVYGFSPYRFVDLYVRGAIGEHVAFIFPPLILWSLEQKKWAIVALCLTGLLLSHNAVSLMFVPIIILYVLYLKRSYIESFASIALGFSLSAFFWIPALFEGKYTLRDIVTNLDFASRFVSFSEFFYSSGNTLSKEIGLVGLCIVGISIYVYFKRREIFLGMILAIFGISILLMLGVSEPIWERVTILQKFQFPWRFLHVVVFCVSVLAGYVVSKMKNQQTVVFVIAVGVVISSMSMWRATSHKEYPEEFFTSVYKGTTDTGESSPIWSVRFMEHEAAAPIEVIEGDAQIEIGSRSTTQHEYKVFAQEKARIRENTLYFPGWQVMVDGAIVPVEFQDPANRGLMTFFVDPGMHNIRVRFTQTKIRFYSQLLSIGAVIFLGCLLVYNRKL